MKKEGFQLKDLKGVALETAFGNITNRPGRRSNPIPDTPDEDEEEMKPGKGNPKRKKKTRAYEVTC